MSARLDDQGPRQAEPEPLVVERDSHVMVVTLNRPKARNAVNATMRAALGEALEEANQSPDIWALVITGAGDVAFCAGADLKELAVPHKRRRLDLPNWGFADFVNHPIAKPTIAAVNGMALGGGTEIALACDLVIASVGATFGLPEVKRGLIASGGGAFRLSEQIPRKIAMEILLTGEPITARRAYEIGLVNSVVDPSDVLPAAVGLAHRICANAPLAVQASKRVATGLLGDGAPSDDGRWPASYSEQQALFASTDAAEGMQAFADKRAPRWVGK
jgi:crotonobetainyl-CoA hydratase